MMAVKPPSDMTPVGPTDRQSAALERARALSRRQQALLAAAGEAVPDQAWIVARVASGKDFAVHKSLADAGVESWVPVVKVVPAWRGGQKKQERTAIDKPVWPGYLFVHCAMTERAWAGLYTVDGMVALLGVEGRPLRVKAEQISVLRACLSSNVDVATKVAGRLAKGDQVVVTKGPFMTFPGVALSDEHNGRAMVEVMIFGRAVPVELSLAQIAKQD